MCRYIPVKIQRVIVCADMSDRRLDLLPRYSMEIEFELIESQKKKKFAKRLTGKHVDNFIVQVLGRYVPLTNTAVAEFRGKTGVLCVNEYGEMIGFFNDQEMQL